MANYLELKERHFPKVAKITPREASGLLNNEELFIKSEVKDPILKEFLNRLEDRYGCLLTNVGCVTNDRWLSVKAITVMVSELDKELKDGLRI